jgi:hypothetical protein
VPFTLNDIGGIVRFLLPEESRFRRAGERNNTVTNRVVPHTNVQVAM